VVVSNILHFHAYLGTIAHFDYYFSNGPKSPTRLSWDGEQLKNLVPPRMKSHGKTLRFWDLNKPASSFLKVCENYTMHFMAMVQTYWTPKNETCQCQQLTMINFALSSVT